MKTWSQSQPNHPCLCHGMHPDPHLAHLERGAVHPSGPYFHHIFRFPIQLYFITVLVHLLFNHLSSESESKRQRLGMAGSIFPTPSLSFGPQKGVCLQHMVCIQRIIQWFEYQCVATCFLHGLNTKAFQHEHGGVFPSRW